MFEHACVDGPEVSREFRVAVEEVAGGDARIFAEETGVDLVARDEHHRGRAVIRAAAGVLTDAAAEFAEGHERHAIGIALRGDVFHERLDGVAEFLEQAVLRVQLIAVRVVAALRDVEDARRQTAADQARDEPQRIAKPAHRISRLVFNFVAGLANFIGADLRVERRAFDVIESRAFAHRRAGKVPNARAGIHFAESVLHVRSFGGIRIHELIILRIVEADAHRIFRRERLRHLPADADADRRVSAFARVVEVTAEPAVTLEAVRIARGLPYFGRTKMRPVRIRVPNPLDHAQLAGVIERFQTNEVRVERNVVINSQKGLVT